MYKEPFMPLQVTYISHATTLIQWNGMNILTDPVFSSRVLFFKRLRPLHYDPSKLPRLDAVLLSHAHYDHLDLFSYKYIPSDVPILIPEGMSKAIAPFVGNPVIELATWSRFPLNKDIQICAVPAKHFAGRFFVSFRYRKCHGYVLISGSESLYFAGDSAYDSHFKDLSHLFKFKLALLPLACDADNLWTRWNHMPLENFLKAWKDLGCPDFIPIHWGSFFKILRGPGNAIEDLQQKAERDPELKSKLHLLQPGEVLQLP